MADFRDYASISLDDYLSHHGILGMMWSKRNGPPYPLDAGDHSAREKKAGWRKSLDSNSPAKDKRSKGSSNESLRDRISDHFSEENRLKRYKARALKKIDKRYDKRIKSAEEDIARQKERSAKKETKNPNDVKLKEKNDRIERDKEFELAALKVMKSKEVKAVMKMKYSDKEREDLAVSISVGKNYIRSGFVAGLGGIALGPLGATIGSIYAATHRNKLRNAKSAYRLNGTTERKHEEVFKKRHRQEILAEMRKKGSGNERSYGISSRVKSRIKSMYNGGLSQAEIAERLGISASSVSKVVNA